MSEENWVANEDVYASQVGDDIALMSHGTSSYFTMNKTGAFIWEQLQNPTTLTQITQAVSEKYDVDPAQCAQDVDALFTQMKNAKLIKMA